jgi:hypothetical protein
MAAEVNTASLGPRKVRVCGGRGGADESRRKRPTTISDVDLDVVENMVVVAVVSAWT